jgi:predicted PurR-regulated permease PerM
MKKALTYLILGIATFLLLGWVFQDIYLYFLISLVIASILRPLNQYLTRTKFFGVKIPRFLSVILSFLTLFLIIQVFSLLFLPLISEQIDVLKNVNYLDLIEQASDPLARFENFFINNNLTSREPGFIMEDMKTGMMGFITDFDFSTMINNLIRYTGSFVIGVLAVGFITFFLLYELGSLRRKIISLIPNEFFEVSISAFTKIEKMLSNYLVGLLFQMASIFTLASIGLSLFGISYAATIALFAAVANLIPYLGPIIGASFGVIVSLIAVGIDVSPDQSNLVMVLEILGVFAVVQITDNVVLQPLIFSKSVKVHPLEIFVIIFAAARLAGIPGMILAIPVYTIIRVSTKEIYTGFKQYQIFKT